MLWNKISELLPLELKALQFSKTHDASCILDTYIFQIVFEMTFSLLFPENESLDLGLDAPEVGTCAGKP